MPTDESPASAALRESERRLRLAVEAARIENWDWDILTNQMVWSEVAKQIARLPQGEPVTFDQISRITHPEDLPRTRAIARRALDPADRSSEPYEYRIVRSDGEVRWVVAHGEAVFRRDGPGERAVRYVGTIRDITDRKRAEAEVKASEARLRIAIDAARLGIWDVDISTGSLRSSPELNRILGLPADQPLDQNELRSRSYPGDESRVREAGAAALARGERHFESEFRLYWSDGSLRWFLVRAEILFAGGDGPVGALGAVIDITDRKQAEERQVFLMRELVHRVRNTLASVRAIAASTLRNSRNLKDAETALTARIAALADVHTLLSNAERRRADLQEIAAAIIEPYRTGEDRIRVSGPSVVLEERDSLALALALHELATNATKYGALAVPEGHVDLSWTAEPDAGGEQLRLRWQERNGPVVRRPRRRGFGTKLIEQALSGNPDGRVDLAFHPDGLACTIEVRVATLAGEDGPA